MLVEIILAVGTLLPIMNPFSTAFVFNSLTAHKPVREQRRIAIISSVTAAITLLLFLALGRFFLSFFGITIYAFRVAGGLYLGKIAFEMLSKNFYKAPDSGSHTRADVAIIPLAIPLLSGPGAMTATLVLADRASIHSYTAIALAIIVVSFISWVVLRNAPWFGRVMGETGANVVERILGLLVLVIAAQFIFNGVTGYLTALGIVL